MPRRFTDTEKRKLLSKMRKLKDKGRSNDEIAEELEVSSATVGRWLSENNYSAAAIPSLPTEKVKHRRSKKLVATQFACPHCGGPITLED